MTKSIGPEGYLELFSAAEGTLRKLRIVSFVGRSAAGGVVNAQFNPDFQPIAVVDMRDGKLRTAEFSDTGNTLGELTQLDTGPSGHTCWAIYTDTGA